MSEYKFKEVMSKPERLAPGHRMCAGCGATIAVRAVLRALHEGDQARNRMPGGFFFHVSIYSVGGQLYP